MAVLNFEKTKGADRELKLTPLDSELWEVYRGAYGNVVNDVKLLTGEEKEFDDWDMALVERRQCRQGRAEDMENTEKIAKDNLMEGLMHQGSFYEATYLAMPYLVQILEKKQENDDVEGQISFITDMGFLVSTDVPYYRGDVSTYAKIDEITENYHLSLRKLQELTKRFLEKHLEEIKQMDEDSYYKVPFLIAVFAILSSDRKAAFAIGMSEGDRICMLCGKCEYYNEDMEIINDEPIEKAFEGSNIIPAASVLGEWDKSSLENDYVWFSNLLSMAGADREVKMMSYYYGTFECPECGNKGLVIDFVKNFYFEEEE